MSFFFLVSSVDDFVKKEVTFSFCLWKMVRDFMGLNSKEKEPLIHGTAKEEEINHDGDGSCKDSGKYFSIIFG